MRKHKLSELSCGVGGHVLGGIVPGRFIYEGGLVFAEPGRVAHADEPRHVHEDGEIFVMLQGRGVVHLDGADETLSAGEVGVIEPDENHHLEADAEDPPVLIYLHAGPERHPNQR